MPPEVSVVVTCYNYGRYISECLASVFEQSFENFEVILVDDGSTDDSEKQIAPFLANHKLKYIRQKNAGQANAKNRGIGESTGRFIAFLDADDKWSSTKLEKQLPLFEEDNVGVVYSRAKYIDENGLDLKKDVEEFGKYLAPCSGNVLDSLLFDNFVPFSSSVVRRKLLISGFDEKLKMAIDWKLWLNLALEHDFSYVDERLLHYRLGHSGQMSINAEERFRCTDIILDEFIRNNETIIDGKAVNAALAHKYYLRWEYYRGKETRLSIRHLMKAVQYKLDFLRVAKGIVKCFF